MFHLGIAGKGEPVADKFSLPPVSRQTRNFWSVLILGRALGYMIRRLRKKLQLKVSSGHPQHVVPPMVTRSGIQVEDKGP